MSRQTLKTFLRTYRIPLLCWLLPLLTGVGIFVAWLVTRSVWLEAAGFYTILAGCLFSLAGILTLPRRQAQFDPVAPRGTLRQSIFCLILLASNFIVAGVIVISVANIVIEEMKTSDGD